MTNPYYEIEYYQCLITGQDCDDDEYRILCEDPEVKSFLHGKENSVVDYETIIEDDNFPENMEGGTLSVWQIVLAAMEGDYRIFDFPEVIPNSPFANAIISYAAGLSNSENFVTRIFEYVEEHCEGEWGPLLTGIAISGDESLLEYFVDVHLDELSDTPYYQGWVQLARKLTGSREVAIYLGTI